MYLPVPGNKFGIGRLGSAMLMLYWNMFRRRNPDPESDQAVVAVKEESVPVGGRFSSFRIVAFFIAG